MLAPWRLVVTDPRNAERLRVEGTLNMLLGALSRLYSSLRLWEREGE